MERQKAIQQQLLQHYSMHSMFNPGMQGGYGGHGGGYGPHGMMMPQGGAQGGVCDLIAYHAVLIIPYNVTAYDIISYSSNTPSLMYYNNTDNSNI